MEWDLEGRTVLVTGANSGIGEATAAALLRRGAEVVVGARDPDRGTAAVDRLSTATGRHPGLLLIDLSSPRSIREAAGRFLAEHEDLAVLVNNAGVFLGRLRHNEEGWEMTMAVNHLGPFLLTNLLLPRMRTSAPARIVTVASVAHRRVNTLDPTRLAGWEGRYRGMAAYARSKLANVLFTVELARRLEGTGITAYAYHPGTVATRIAQDGDTRIAGYAWKLLSSRMRTPEQGAATGVFLATEPGIEAFSGGYFVDEAPRPPSRLARDPDLARRVWEESARLVGC